MPTLADIHELAWKARNPSWQSHLNCGPINREINNAIQQHYDIDTRVVDETGKIRYKEGMRAGTEHAFVLIPASEIDDVSRGPLIIDGALDQFCTENKEDGYVSVGIAPRTQFSRVEILQPGDAFYHWYMW